METLRKAGRILYGICIAGLGAQQFIYADFRPVFIPAWPSWIPGLPLWAYLAGAAIIAAGAAIIFKKKARTAALVLGGIFFLLFALYHTPHLIFINPYGNHLGTWTNAFKVLALSGGAFVVAGSLSEEKATGAPLMRVLEKFIPFGRIFFSITMITFGIDHFLYVEFVAPLVPRWIPGDIFWTYFAGVALIGSGTAIILKIKLKLVAMLLGIMIFLWFLILHIPRAVADPYIGQGNEVTSVFQALGFSGIAFMIAFGVRSREAE